MYGRRPVTCRQCFGVDWLTRALGLETRAQTLHPLWFLCTRVTNKKKIEEGLFLGVVSIIRIIVLVPFSTCACGFGTITWSCIWSCAHISVQQRVGVHILWTFFGKHWHFEAVCLLSWFLVITSYTHSIYKSLITTAIPPSAGPLQKMSILYGPPLPKQYIGPCAYIYGLVLVAANTCTHLFRDLHAN